MRLTDLQDGTEAPNMSPISCPKFESSHQWKHISTDHVGLEPEDVEFGMQVIRRCRSSLER